MKFFHLFLLLIFCSLSAQAQETASWLRTNVSNVLNPNISVIGDFVAQTGPNRESDDFSMREVELVVQANVDPNTRADFFFGMHEGESFELEEGYFTLLTLPGGFLARGGKFNANFGRLNMVHLHELPQTDRPLVLTSFLGEEGLNDTGLELSCTFAPADLFTEVTYAFINGLGEEHHEDVTTAEVLAIDGSTVTVAVHEPEEDLPRTIRNFAHVARIRVFKDISDDSNIEAGLSGALHQPKDAEQREMAAFDFTYRWKPLREAIYKSFVWRSEILYSNRKLEDPTVTVESMGAYSYMEVQPARRWRFGVRGDYVEDPEAQNLLLTRGVAPYVTFVSSEFSRYRLQYVYKDLPDGLHEHIGYAQWTIVIGPHGAHAF